MCWFSHFGDSLGQESLEDDGGGEIDFRRLNRILVLILFSTLVRRGDPYIVWISE